MGPLLAADISQLLKMIPKGSELKSRQMSFMPRRSCSIKKIDEDRFMYSDTHNACTIDDVITEITNKRISLAEVIRLAESNEDFSFDIDENGQFNAYNTTLEQASKDRKNLKSDSLILFRETMPKQLVDAGLADSPTKISAFVYDKVKSRVDNAKRHGHHYDDADLQKIKIALDKPLAIIRSKTKDGSAAVAVLTSVPDFKNHPSLVILQKDEERGDNWISSIYGKDNVVGYLKKQQKDGNMLFLKEDIADILSDALSEEDVKTLKEMVSGQINTKESEKTTLSKIDEIVSKAKKNKR